MTLSGESAHEPPALMDAVLEALCVSQCEAIAKISIAAMCWEDLGRATHTCSCLLEVCFDKTSARLHLIYGIQIPMYICLNKKQNEL